MNLKASVLLAVGLLVVSAFPAGAQWPYVFGMHNNWPDLQFSYDGNLSGTLLYDSGSGMTTATGGWSRFYVSYLNTANHPQWAWIQNHDFYCVDLLGPFHNWEWRLWPSDHPGVPGVEHFQGSQTGLLRAGYLYGQWAASLRPGMTQDDMNRRAGLQLAIWEAIYDGDDFGAFGNLAAGDFYVEYSSLGTNEQAAYDYARLTLLADPQGIGQRRAGFYEDGQYLIGPDPIPEPGTLLLLGLGLAGSGLAVLRRKR